MVAGPQMGVDRSKARWRRGSFSVRPRPWSAQVGAAMASATAAMIGCT
jgi:hypothetical protein